MRSIFWNSLLLVSIFGCSSAVSVHNPDEFKKHAIVVSGDGEMLVPNPYAQDSRPIEYLTYIDGSFSYRADPQFRVSREFTHSKVTAEIENYATTVAESMIAKRNTQIAACKGAAGAEPAVCDNLRQKVLVYIHGGLNSLEDSTERVNTDLFRIPDEYYPLFINWDSGFGGSYWDHLMLVRQGEEWPRIGWMASPFEFAYDLGRSIVRAPLTWGTTIQNDADAVPQHDSTATKNALEVFQAACGADPKQEGTRAYGLSCITKPSAWNIELGENRPASLKTLGKGVWYTLTFVPEFLVAPFVDGFGSSTWDMQLRRTETIFDKPGDFSPNLGDTTPASIAGSSAHRGTLSIFLKKLKKYLGSDIHKFEITLVAHSMGTIIANRVINENPEFSFKYIIYMAGADSIKNTYQSIFTYLEYNIHSHFYNLSLHPDNEKEEMNAGGFVPRGSLLVWIDNYFSTPSTHLDRTVGVWENIIPTINLIPDDLRSRIFIKAFSYIDCVEHHTDFGQAPFWDPAFWTPGQTSAGCTAN